MTRRQKRRSPGQNVQGLQEGEAMLAGGKTVADRVQKLEMSEGTWIRWKKQYRGMKTEEANRLKELVLENRRLTELIAEAELDRRMLKAVAQGNFYARRGSAKRSSTSKTSFALLSVGLARLSRCRLVPGGTRRPSRVTRRR